MQVTAVLTAAEEGGFVAYNPEADATSQGATVEDAMGNLREAVESYLEVFPMRIVGAPLVTSFTVVEHA